MKLAGLLAQSKPWWPSRCALGETVACRTGFVNRFYSYGDSAGLTPDFPFNPIPLWRNKNQIRCKCKAWCCLQPNKKIRKFSALTPQHTMLVVILFFSVQCVFNLAIYSNQFFISRIVFMKHKWSIKCLNIILTNSNRNNIVNFYNNVFVFSFSVPPIKNFVSLFSLFVVVGTNVNQWIFNSPKKPFNDILNGFKNFSVEGF